MPDTPAAAAAASITRTTPGWPIRQFGALLTLPGDRGTAGGLDANGQHLLRSGAGTHYDYRPARVVGSFMVSKRLNSSVQPWR